MLLRAFGPHALQPIVRDKTTSYTVSGKLFTRGLILLANCDGRFTVFLSYSSQRQVHMQLQYPSDVWYAKCVRIVCIVCASCATCVQFVREMHASLNDKPMHAAFLIKKGSASSCLTLEVSEFPPHISMETVKHQYFIFRNV